jgi:hypothetical protein
MTGPDRRRPNGQQQPTAPPRVDTGLTPAQPAEATVSETLRWTTWPQARADLQLRLPAATLAHLDAVVDLAQRWAPTEGHRRHALHVLQVLTVAGLTDPDVLAAGALIAVVRAGACPIPEVRRHFDSAVSTILLRLVPVATARAEPEPARDAALRLLGESSPAVQAVAFADAYVRAADLAEHADTARADLLAEEIGTHLLPLAVDTPPFGRLLTAALANLTPAAAGRRHDVWNLNPDAFAARLRLLRDHAQVLPGEVALAADLPADLYTRLESGQADPGLLEVVQLQALAIALGVDVRELLHDPPPP